MQIEKQLNDARRKFWSLENDAVLSVSCFHNRQVSTLVAKTHHFAIVQLPEKRNLLQTNTKTVTRRFSANCGSFSKQLIPAHKRLDLSEEDDLSNRDYCGSLL